MYQSPVSHIGLSVSIALHAIALVGLLVLWRAPVNEPNKIDRNSISVELLKTVGTTVVSVPSASERTIAVQTKPAPLSTSAAVRAEPNQEPVTEKLTSEQVDTAINATTSTTVMQKNQRNWGLDKDQAAQVLKQGTLNQQAREQVGTKQLTEQELLAKGIERAAKPSCLGDRGMGLFNIPFIVKDIANDKCKWD
jgi:hypothetical protein